MEEKSLIPKKVELPVKGWRSACFTIDPRFTTFVCQFVISFVALALCVFKLRETDTCEAQSFYGNILTTLLGLWMPSPLALKYRPK